MEQGKFSSPRPHRDEERQIEEAFRQVTGQKAAPQPRPQTPPRQAPVSQSPYQCPQNQPAQNPIQPNRTPQGQPTYSNPSTRQDPYSFEQQSTQGPLYGDDTSFYSQREYAPQQPYQPKHQAPEDPFAQIPAEEDFLFEQPQEPADEDWIDKAMAFYNKNKKYILCGLFAAALILIISVVAIFRASMADPYDNKILSNVTIGGLDVGGMTKNEAIALLQDASAQTYESEDMVIDLAGTPLLLTPRDTGAAIDAKSAVEEAYAYGRTGTQEERDLAYESSRWQTYAIDLLPYLLLDEDSILDTLMSYGEDSGSTFVQTTYGLEGTEPALDYENFDEKAPTQTLVITLGTPGIGFDAHEVFDRVLEAYGAGIFLVTVEDVEEVGEPDPVDLEAIYKEFYIAPVDASVDPQTYETIPGSYGYGFDMELAQKLLDQADYGDEIRIPMEYIEPELLDSEMFFRDVLGSYETRYSSNNDRTTNLKLACEAIHGLVLNPGEEFSFLGQTGEPTTRKGYKTVVLNNGLKDEETVGGGICQVASTLYCSALIADMEITSRTNHAFLPSYTDFGLDADIVWNSKDLCFRNTSRFPVRIEAKVSGGYVKIHILGTDDRDYSVELDTTITDTYEPETEYQDYAYDNREGYEDGDILQDGITGYRIKTYKVRYDKNTGKQLGKDFVADTQYKTVNKVVARVEEEPVETTVETEPPTVPTTAPTQPPETTAPPPETTVPPTVPETQPTTAPMEEPQQESVPEEAET